jgi:hypothetical protein
MLNGLDLRLKGSSSVAIIEDFKGLIDYSGEHFKVAFDWKEIEISH